MTPAELDALTESWITHMQAERKSPHTIRTYTAGVAAFRRWCVSSGWIRCLDRATVEKFTAALLDAGAEAATALSRQRGVRRFSAWLAAEGEIGRDELTGMKPPKLDEKIPQELTGAQVTAMLATCSTRDFHDIRDDAVIRLMTESMVRAGELLGMLTADIDIRGGSAVVRRGKGGREAGAVRAADRPGAGPLRPGPAPSPTGRLAAVLARRPRPGPALIRGCTRR